MLHVRWLKTSRDPQYRLVEDPVGSCAIYLASMADEAFGLFDVPKIRSRCMDYGSDTETGESSLSSFKSTPQTRDLARI